MFNDRFGLTAAVLEGQKTMTRRIATTEEIECPDIGCVFEGKNKGKRILCNYYELFNYYEILAMSRYAKGEVIAVAQRYCDVLHCADVPKGEEKGWGNKMFVKAELMPHHIKITGIKVERLQDISDEDCLREGICKTSDACRPYYIPNTGRPTFANPREAFAALIDKVSGKGTWERNPYCFCYTFKLID